MFEMALLFLNTSKMMITRGYSHDNVKAKCQDCSSGDFHVHGQPFLHKPREVHGYYCRNIQLLRSFDQIKYDLSQMNTQQLTQQLCLTWVNTNNSDAYQQCRIVCLPQVTTWSLKNMKKYLVSVPSIQHAIFIGKKTTSGKTTDWLQKSVMDCAAFERQKRSMNIDSSTLVAPPKIEHFNHTDLYVDRQAYQHIPLTAAEATQLCDMYKVLKSNLPVIRSDDAHIRFLGLQFRPCIVKTICQYDDLNPRTQYRYIQSDIKVLYAEKEAPMDGV
jgi:DNA-directed RNA polymerase subunit H (RpoH/RPB5)